MYYTLDGGGQLENPSVYSPHPLGTLQKMKETFKDGGFRKMGSSGGNDLSLLGMYLPPVLPRDPGVNFLSCSKAGKV